MSKFALVSTVDSMGPEFPGHCVMLFENLRDAYQFATELVAKHDNSFQYIPDEALWLVGDEHYECPEDALAEWQSNLGPTEFFHVMPVSPVEESSTGLGKKEN